MAYDPIIAEILRSALAGLPVSERKMFGGLAFMLHGNMICGALAQDAMFRVGPAHYAAALALDGVSKMTFTGREMRGFVTIDAGALDDQALRDPLVQMALNHVQTLPAK